MVHLLDRKLLFVTGKGGVGKTAVAAGLALLAAGKGKRTLVCEVDAKGDLASAFETGPTQFQEREVLQGLWAMSMDSEASLRQYLSLQLRLPRAAVAGPVARMFDFVASAAPGVREIVTVGKLCWEVRERHYDIVVVDAVATGHIVGQLAAPQAINKLVQVGLVRQQTGWMLDILSNPATTGAVIVATPEEMPVTETIELMDRLKTETTVDLAAIVVNRVLPELFASREEQVFEALGDATARSVLGTELDGPPEPLLEAARLMVRTRRSRAAHLERLRSAVMAGGPELLYVPYLFLRSYGLRSTRQVAAALAAELEN
ncbi:MAG TPA: ArsA-related P-loop ATPase [Acidimicrobiales bacterium]|nr:ArsA-related P-loop ATPase [Acidimicrobiales bacterium]